MSICVHTVGAASDPDPTNPPTVPPQTLDRHLCTFERQFYAPVVAEPGACWTVEPNANAPEPAATAAAAAAAVSTTPPYATVAGVAAEVQSIKVCMRAGPPCSAVDHDHDASLGMQSMS
eukprot:COSAG01_NODE_7473_length_3196_cov_2.514046_3_plen_119_part_00